MNGWHWGSQPKHVVKGLESQTPLCFFVLLPILLNATLIVRDTSVEFRLCGQNLSCSRVLGELSDLSDPVLLLWAVGMTMLPLHGCGEPGASCGMQNAVT